MKETRNDNTLWLQCIKNFAELLAKISPFVEMTKNAKNSAPDSYRNCEIKNHQRL